MADKTIKELAEELGVTKQAIRKHIDKLPPTLIPTKIKGVYTLNADIQDFIRKRMNVVTTKVSSNHSNEIDTAVGDLKDSIIENLQQDKDDLKSQVEILQKLLDQQQQLTLQSNKRIDQLEAQLQLETKKNDEEVISPGAETLADPPPTPEKKWWHFFR